MGRTRVVMVTGGGSSAELEGTRHPWGTPEHPPSRSGVSAPPEELPAAGLTLSIRPGPSTARQPARPPRRRQRPAGPPLALPAPPPPPGPYLALPGQRQRDGTAASSRRRRRHPSAPGPAPLSAQGAPRGRPSGPALPQRGLSALASQPATENAHWDRSWIASRSCATHPKRCRHSAEKYITRQCQKAINHTGDEVREGTAAL